MSTATSEIPRGDLAGLVRYWRYDLLSGFLVFLIALPLCLGIALACGYPAIAGIFTAIIGGVLSALLSNSELTIKGPAAGLIVIAIGCVSDFGYTAGQDPAADLAAYRLALGVGVAAAILQILFGLFRTGILGEFFPTSAVHGMLAAIGIIIMAKQFPIALGVSAAGEPLELIRQIPAEILHMNPEIALIGLVSLLILFGLPLIQHPWVRRIPAPMVVILVAVPLGMYFDLTQEHTYTLFGEEYHVGEEFLVSVPDNMFAALTTPDFSGLQQPRAWKWVIMFALIGTLESILSAKAIDLLDPWKRKTNLDRDLVAVGVGNLVAALVGGLPMISEIVRSRANIDNGARTRFANLFHGLFLLLFVWTVPWLIHRIPLAALAAMLVYTGFRLASPREFVHVFKIGREQLIIYVTTIVAVLATDLLIGIGIGIAVKVLIHLLNGVPVRSLFKPDLEIMQKDAKTCLIVARQSAVFSNWILFRRRIENVGLVQRNNVQLDLSQTRLVDHSVMEKLHALEEDFRSEGLSLELVGLDLHRKASSHDFSARRGGLTPIRRLTIICPSCDADEVLADLVQQGASGYTVTDCRGAGRASLHDRGPARESLVRIEVLVSADKVEPMIASFRRRLRQETPLTLSLETVNVVRHDHF
jgi:MFS superfamily sulfate permease-like transporter